MLIFIKTYIYIYIFFKLTLSKVSIMHIFICTNNILYLLQNNTKKTFLLFKTQGLYYHELIFCKLVNLQKPRYYDGR